jgi:hypothetical protein
MYEVHELKTRYSPEEVRLGAYQWCKWTIIATPRKKQDAIDMVAAHPTRATATIRFSAQKVADNNKPAIIDRSI